MKTKCSQSQNPSTGSSPLFLAPMAGFTNAATRRIAGRYGAALTWTEMANATGLVHASTPTWQILETFPDEGPVVAHLYGSDPGDFAKAARLIAATGRFVAIDLNAGCPVRRITAGGAGAALMLAPSRIGAIVAAIRAACDLPVTVKTRLGPRPGCFTAAAVLHAAEDAGAAALALHARYTSQGHAGPTDLESFARLRRNSRIPIIGNGGINDTATAARFLRDAGADALMVGQAAIGRPWIFRQIANGLAGTNDGASAAPPDPVPLADLRAVIFDHLEGEVQRLRLIAGKYQLPDDVLAPEAAVVIGFRCHFFRYLRGLKGVSQARGQLDRLQTLDEVQALVDACLAREAAYRARVGR